MTHSLNMPSAQSSGSEASATDPRDVEVREMLLMIICALVDDVENVVLLHVADAEGTSFQVRTAPTDIGKLIGKSGRTARAIRTILNASAVKNRRRYTLDIAHSPGHEQAGTALSDSADVD